MTNLEELERLEALAMAVAGDSGKKLFFSHAQFRNAANPATIISLIQRVKEAEFDAATTRASVVSYQRGYADGRAEGLEEAAKVADYHTSVDSASISQAIRALGEKA